MDVTAPQTDDKTAGEGQDDGQDDPAVGSDTRARKSRGFTLIELLVVLVILGLLAGLAVPQVLQQLSKAKSATASIALDSLGSALDLYRLDVGRFPSQDEGIEALFERPDGARKWFGPYIKKRDMLLDPWDYPYRYRIPGEHGVYDLYSLGADNTEGGEDEDRDLVSW